MATIEPTRSRRAPLVWSAVIPAVRLLIFALIAWLLLVSAVASAWRAGSLAPALALAAGLALAVLVGITWYLPRARAERRWRAALDAYAKKGTDEED